MGQDNEATGPICPKAIGAATALDFQNGSDWTFL